MTQRRSRRLVFLAIIGVGTAACIEGAAWLGLRIAGPGLDEPVLTTTTIYAQQRVQMQRLLDSTTVALGELDTLLGWRYHNGYHAGLHQINAQGLRAARDYAPERPRGVTRVAAFGDSFVYGNEVANADAWPAQIEALFPGVEMLNYGVGGYGDDQAFLRFQRDGMALHPQVVVLGFTQDDLGRVVNVYRRFRSLREQALGKPRFRLTPSGALELLPTPLGSAADYLPYLQDPSRIRALGANDYWYNRWIYDNPVYNVSAAVRLALALWIRVERRVHHDHLLSGGAFDTTSSAFRIQRTIFARFAQEARARGARPLILLLPDHGVLARARAGRRTIYAPLADAMRADSVPFVDLVDAFLARPAGGDAAWFSAGGHYSPAGNRVVAQWLAPKLRELATN